MELLWDKPASERWESALSFQDVSGLTLEDISARQAKAGASTAAIVLEQVEDAILRQVRAQPGTSVFLEVRGDRSKEIYLRDSDMRQAETVHKVGAGSTEAAVKLSNNLTKKK